MPNDLLTAPERTIAEPALPVPTGEGATLLSVIGRAASDPNTDVDKLERLMSLYERVTERQAKAEYTAALAELQIELPEIEERGAIKIGHGNAQRYALWEDINVAIKPLLNKHGFALSFKTGRDGDRVSVTGILSHRAGHSEETTMWLPVDNSGSKNAVQGIGSSTSYGKRYVASALLNITSRGEDDDGWSGGTQTITTEQIERLSALADEVGADKIKYCAHLKVVSIAAIPASRYREAEQALLAKKAAKR